MEEGEESGGGEERERRQEGKREEGRIMGIGGDKGGAGQMTTILRSHGTHSSRQNKARHPFHETTYPTWKCINKVCRRKTPTYTLSPSLPLSPPGTPSPPLDPFSSTER